MKKTMISNSEKSTILNATNFDEILNIQYGKIGEKKRDEFEEKAQCFVISEILEVRTY